MELLSYMRLFVEVARTRSFRRAAEALDMPNSTLSRHIAELEKTIGLRLLHRSTRKVELTEAGDVYFKRCQSIVEEARIAHESLLDVVERPSGTLRVSMPADLATGYLAPILADFATTYPLIAFEFDLTPRRIDLQADPFDLALRIGPPPTAPSMLVARQIALLPRYLYAAPGYLKKAPPLTVPDDLRHHVMCIAQGTLRQGDVVRTLYRGDESVEVTTPTRFAMNSVGLTRSLAAHGVGIAAMDTELARDDVDLGRLVRVLPEWSLSPVQVHAITETRLLPARTRLFIEFLKARLGNA
ncbi:LysR family transcriptional regulator [Paraburkholderia phenazinium]|uniref:Transcriptional regulator, LysR family n=1 Tax=Paraburkholderia phenazinium TaxID=60549 RepID=A0A1N6GHD2_9BURK|nr:LysR family transcriptional regulator [Paraburkholderia phenazinium]SIO06914.1 transcriptional regulator, LysR family [Paraburkholderia phenazinium]